MANIRNRIRQTMLGRMVVSLLGWDALLSQRDALLSQRDALLSEADLDVFQAATERTSINHLKKMIEEGRLQIVIPTINSESYIDIILSYYRRHGIPVKVCVDGKTSDTTAAIASRFAEVEIYNNESLIAEEFIEKISCSGREWVLRMDDDELPSLQMLQFIASILDDKAIDVYGFPRLQCVVSTTGKIFASTLHSPRGSHHQWRLYRPDKLKFLKAIHTPGFQLPENRSHAPKFASMIHLDWSLHSYAQRFAKIARYNEHTQNAGSDWRSYYLFEDDLPRTMQSLRLIGLSEFYEVAQEVSRRLIDNCITEKMS